jgi:hypothetical protein
MIFAGWTGKKNAAGGAWKERGVFQLMDELQIYWEKADVHAC